MFRIEKSKFERRPKIRKALPLVRQSVKITLLRLLRIRGLYYPRILITAYA